jgi:hypothetical protein
MTYYVKSMSELADVFYGYAKNCYARAERGKDAREEIEQNARAQAWNSAAEMVRHTIVDPDHEKKDRAP